MKNAHNNLVFSTSRKQKSVVIPGIDAMRQSFQTAPELTMIQLLTTDSLTSERVAAAYLLLAEKTDVAFRSEFVMKLLQMQPVDQVLEIFLALKKNRVNRSFVTRTTLKYLWTCPWFEELIAVKPGVIRAIIEHVLGRNTARGAVAALVENPADAQAVKTLTWGYMPNQERAVDCILTLYGYKKQTKIQLTGRRATRLHYPTWHEETFKTLISATPEQKTVKVTTRGPISAALYQIYQGAQGPEYDKAIQEAVQKCAGRIVRTAKRVALVQDLSGSTRGTGEREYGCVTQNLAFQYVLEKVCNLSVFPVGGRDSDGTIHNPPQPNGETDLASALIDALSVKPDMVLIVSDGYENFLDGDLDWVLQALPEEYASIPTTFIHSKFTPKDSLEKRRPTTRLPELEFWHENDFQNICASLFKNAQVAPDESEREEQRTFLKALLC